MKGHNYIQNMGEIVQIIQIYDVLHTNRQKVFISTNSVSHVSSVLKFLIIKNLV